MNFFNNRRGWIVSVTALMTAVAGCGAASDELEVGESDLGETSDGITRGQLVPAGVEAPDTSAVNLLTGSSTSQSARCSGIKIAPRRYLTAHHCLFSAGRDIFVTNSLAGKPGTRITLSKVYSHPTTFNITSDNLRQDFQILEVAQDNDIPSYSTYRKSRVGQNVTGWLTSYGCDFAPNSENGGKKQYGALTTGFDSRPGYDTTFMFVPQDTTGAAVCYGDSGGPFFIKQSGVWELAGIVSGSVEIGRISSVYAWVHNPLHNHLASGQKGFLLHKASNRPLGLATTSTTAVPVVQIWDGRTHSTGVDKQYWQIFAGAGSNFRIKNTASGACLKANSDGTMSQATCSGVAGDQAFKFENLSSEYYQIRNPMRNACLQVATSAGKTELRGVACNANTADQRWLYSL
jgi:secreted trypsin-like serine protease